MNDETQIILTRINEVKEDLQKDIQDLHSRISRHGTEIRQEIKDQNTRLLSVEKEQSSHGQQLATLMDFRAGFWGKTVGLIGLLVVIFFGAGKYIWGG